MDTHKWATFTHQALSIMQRGDIELCESLRLLNAHAQLEKHKGTADHQEKRRLVGISSYYVCILTHSPSSRFTCLGCVRGSLLYRKFSTAMQISLLLLLLRSEK